MSEDILIPKMTRRNKRKRKVKIHLLNLIIVIFGTLLLVASTFLNIDIKHYFIPFDIFTNKNLTAEDFIYSFFIIPQIPMLMFVCSALGKRMAITSVVLYILAGITVFPIFALGGGIRYVLEYGFGYIFAYLPAAVIVGNLLGKKYTYPDMIKATLAGVLSIHVLGILYMCIIAIAKHDGIGFITGWIAAQSGLKIIYDLIFSFVLVIIGKYLHKVLLFITE